ncbi:MAG: aldehyde dehydrogenase family protein [Bacteroidetes bacterium]|nr:aldehyde dehydrogenase family protein [Bacteroidota bacterium]
MKKRIGISYTKTNFQNYWNWFTSEDLKDDIELVKLSFEENNTEEIFTCDGFVLTGGIDIDPSFYNANASYANAPDGFQKDRDLFEKKIFEYSQLHQLPLLGICRGMQLVNVLQGGKLLQDLSASNNIHKKEDKDKEHEVVAETNSLLSEITRSSSGKINSAHHQAIDKNAVGKDLKISAYSKSDDKTVEALEFNDKAGKGFMLCVQWHPERLNGKEESPFSQNIKQRFLAEIRKITMEKIALINPATEEVIEYVNEDTQQTLEEKFKQLRKAQPAWASVPVKERVDCIRRFVSLIDKYKDELAKTLTSEMGKPLQQSHNELNGAKAKIQFFLDNSEKWLAEEWINKDGATKEKIVYEPLGVIANISAWNYPYLVAINVVIPALIGGNAVFYKPSEYTILTGMHIQKMMYEAGVHEHCFELAIGKGSVGATLLQLPLNGYFFTGSYKTGKFIAEKIAHKLVPCQLELGGKDPLYVMDDVEDINTVAANVLEGVIYNNGQSCCAVERVYVHEKIYDAFVKSYTEHAKKLVAGDPMDAKTEIGPLSRKEQVDFLIGQIEDAKEKGATVLCGGNKINGKGYFIEPTVLVNVNHGMKVMKEESFGPVIGIQKVKDDEEAVALMQDTEYGLTAAVYSKSFERAEKIMKQMNTGTVYWNCCDRVSGALPWSGRKHSGLGSTLSYQGIRAFVQPKAYHIRG